MAQKENSNNENELEEAPDLKKEIEELMKNNMNQKSGIKKILKDIEDNDLKDTERDKKINNL